MSNFRRYPALGAPDVIILNALWIAVPVRTPDSIANCYINGTGVADFTDDPQWDDFGVFTGEFHIKFTKDSPLEPDDIVLPEWTMATVGMSHIDHEGGDKMQWALQLLTADVMDVPRNTTDLEVVIQGAYAGDAWIDRIAYEIDLLVYRPRLTRIPRSSDPAAFLPWKMLASVVGGYAASGHQAFRPRRVR